MDFQNLKKALDHCHLSLNQSKKLEEEREHKHKQLLALKEESILQGFDIKEKLELLRKELREIDHALDEIGDEQKEVLARLKEEIASEIQKSSPQAKDEFYQLGQKRKKMLQQLENLLQLKKILSPFYEALKKGLAENTNQGFLRFLFARRKKVNIASAIHEAALHAQKIPSQSLDETWQKLIEDFLTDAQKTWNSALYKKKYYHYFDNVHAFMEKLEEEIHQESQNKIQTEKEIEDWFEKWPSLLV